MKRKAFKKQLSVEEVELINKVIIPHHRSLKRGDTIPDLPFVSMSPE